MPNFYSKELPETPVWVGGMPVKFDILKTEDPKLIEHLEACIKNQCGGVIRIDEATYESELKKKANGSPSAFDSKLRPHRLELSARLNLAAGAAAEGTPVNKDDLIAKRQANSRSPNESPVNGRTIAEPIRTPSPNQFSGLFAPKLANLTPP